MSEKSAIPDLEQKDYNKPELAVEASKQLVGLINGKYPIEVSGLGKMLVKKPQYQEHSDVEAFKATETIRVIGKFPGVMTERKLRKFLDKSGLWTAEDERELELISRKLDEQEKTLRDLVSPTKDRNNDEVRELDKEVVSLREERNEIASEKQKLFANSLEGVVTAVSHMYMTWRCTYDDTGKTLKWKGLDEMLSLPQNQLSELNLEVWKVLLGLREDFLDSKPEAKSGE